MLRKPFSEVVTAGPEESITIAPPPSRIHGVRVDKQEPWPFLAAFPVCPDLARYRILHTGIRMAYAPYRLVRPHLTNRYFMACFGGEGRVLVDGRFRALRPGMAALLPAHVLNEFYAAGKAAWEFCYVCYAPTTAEPPGRRVTSPILARYDAEPLRHAIAGLEAECAGAAQPAVMHHWVELIEGYVRQFAQPVSEDNPLHRLWLSVAGDLGGHWTLDTLAREAHCSPEHLRRLCLRHVGRSPMHHLTYLRMERAAELLAGTDEKVEQISLALGYESRTAFSAMFKKWIGWAPSEYGRHKGSSGRRSQAAG